MSYHAVYVVSFIIYLILTVNCRTVSKSVHCPFVISGGSEGGRWGRSPPPKGVKKEKKSEKR